MSIDKFTKTPTPIEVVEKVNNVIDAVDGSSFDGYWEAGETIEVGDMRYISGRDNVGYVLSCTQGGVTGDTVPSISDDDISNTGTISTNINNLPGVLGISKGGTGATNSVGILSNLGITAKAAELNFCIGATTNIQDQLDSKLNIDGVASKALSDGSGNVISDTYALKNNPEITGILTAPTINSDSIASNTITVTNLTVSTTLNIPGGKIWIS